MQTGNEEAALVEKLQGAVVASSSQNIIDLDSSPLVITSSIKKAEKGVAVEKFQGVVLSTDLVPSTSSQNILASDLNPPSMETGEKDASVAKLFQGIVLSNDLVPVLLKLWDKHGDIIEGHTIRSEKLLKWALESLAEMIIILQQNTGNSLNASQAENLKSTLVDLQSLNFRLEWLVPFVNRASKALEIRGKIDVISKLEATRSKLEATRSKLVAELREVEEKILAEQKNMIVADGQVDSQPLVLDKCLAEGLY